MQSQTARADVGSGQLARLTGAKWVGNVALRWIPFFLFVLEDALDATTTQLTLILGLGEMAGLGTLLIGRMLDRGRERMLMLVALVLLSGSGVIALAGSLVTFAVSFVLVIAGLGTITVSGHAWLSHRVPFERRGRAIGIFEMSWAGSLLIGAPLVALLIELFGWRAPFVFVAVVSAVMAWFVAGLADAPAANEVSSDAEVSAGLGSRAMSAIAMSAAIACAGLSTIVIIGTWLEDDFGISTGGVGLTAMAFGFAEMIASGSSARFSDQLGKERTTSIAMRLVVAGLAVMMLAGTSLAIAVIGLALFFLGFEYAVVTSFVIVSEAAPHARGRALATNNAVSTVARGGGTIMSGVLYEAFGISGPAIWSAAAAVIAVALLAISQRQE